MLQPCYKNAQQLQESSLWKPASDMYASQDLSLKPGKPLAVPLDSSFKVPKSWIVNPSGSGNVSAVKLNSFFNLLNSVERFTLETPAHINLSPSQLLTSIERAGSSATISYLRIYRSATPHDAYAPSFFIKSLWTIIPSTSAVFLGSIRRFISAKARPFAIAHLAQIHQNCLGPWTSLSYHSLCKVSGVALREAW